MHESIYWLDSLWRNYPGLILGWFVWCLSENQRGKQGGSRTSPSTSCYWPTHHLHSRLCIHPYYWWLFHKLVQAVPMETSGVAAAIYKASTLMMKLWNIQFLMKTEGLDWKTYYIYLVHRKHRKSSTILNIPNRKRGSLVLKTKKNMLVEGDCITARNKCSNGR